MRRERVQNVLDVVWILLLTLLVGLILVLVCKAPPAKAIGLFFNGIFGSVNGFTEIFVKACPLILTGLGCAVSYRTGFFNIGGEGQFYVAAMVSAMVVLNMTFLPGILRIILALVLGFIAGGLWALIAALLKAKFNISEIIVTIMLNYIAINFLGYAVRSFLMDPEGNVPQSPKVEPAAQLPVLIPRTRFHAGILLAVAACFVVWFLLEKTTVGYEIKAVGLNMRASSCSGISAMKNIVLSAFLSGGLAGIAGVVEVLAIQKKLLEGISSGCGYTAVLIALVAGNNPLKVLAAAIIYAAAQVGAGSMQRQLGIPSAIVSILIGVVVVLVLGKEIFHTFRTRTIRKGGGSL